MIARVMSYATEVALLVALAAWAIERVAIWRGSARRGCWAAALVLSVAIPIINILIPAKTPPQTAVSAVAMISRDPPARAIAAPLAPAQRTSIPAATASPEPTAKSALRRWHMSDLT